MTDLSVIVISYNTLDLTRACLTSLTKAFRPKGGLEIVVADNASTDGSPAMIKKDFPEVKLIKNKQNLGFAAANNQGVKVASGKYLLFLNSDTKVARDALTKPLKYLAAHPKVGGLTVKLILPGGKLDPDNHRGEPDPWTSITYFTGLAKLFPQSRLFNNYHQSYRNLNSVHSIDITAGSYLMMSRKLFDAIGGWDEQFFFYGEDIDLSFRIRQAGKSLVYFPKVTVIHYKGASSGLRKEGRHLAKPPKENRIRVARSSTRAMELFYQKYYFNRYPKLLTGLVIAMIRLMGHYRVIKASLS